MKKLSLFGIIFSSLFLLSACNFIGGGEEQVSAEPAADEVVEDVSFDFEKVVESTPIPTVSDPIPTAEPTPTPEPEPTPTPTPTPEPTPEPEPEPEVVVPTVKSFSMTAKRWEFTPSTITVSTGDVVKLTITSMDVDHGFSIPQFGVSQRLTSGQTFTVQFTADKAGTYSFFCNVFCGSGHGGMRGTLIVQ